MGFNTARTLYIKINSIIDKKCYLWLLVTSKCAFRCSQGFSIFFFLTAFEWDSGRFVCGTKVKSWAERRSEEQIFSPNWKLLHLVIRVFPTDWNPNYFDRLLLEFFNSYMYIKNQYYRSCFTLKVSIHRFKNVRSLTDSIDHRWKNLIFDRLYRSIGLKF